MNVWSGPTLTKRDETFEERDYFVRFDGSAVRERGFHPYLANFLELDLPQVIKYDGTHCPLYLEELLSLHYVEQTRGCGSIQNILPTYLSIKDIAQRTIEFSLDIEIQIIRRKREEILLKISDLERKWTFFLKNWKQSQLISLDIFLTSQKNLLRIFYSQEQQILLS